MTNTISPASIESTIESIRIGTYILRTNKEEQYRTLFRVENITHEMIAGETYIVHMIGKRHSKRFSRIFVKEAIRTGLMEIYQTLDEIKELYPEDFI